MANDFKHLKSVKRNEEMDMANAMINENATLRQILAGILLMNNRKLEIPDKYIGEIDSTDRLEFDHDTKSHIITAKLVRTSE